MKRILVIMALINFLAFNVEAQSPVRGQGGERVNANNQSQIEIKGSIIESTTGKPLEFATISIYDKNTAKLIGGGISEMSGNFSMNASSGELYAEIEFISFETATIDPLPEPNNGVIDLGEIILSADGVQLDAVQITAEKSETQFTLDKKVFNVGKDLANKGGNAQDILDNVPSVTVDVEGTVSLRGSSNVRILVNGRPSGLIGIGDTNGLRSIPSNMIERIEVITNPSARYEAEGMAGIINIVMKKDDRGGFNGSFDVTGGLPNEYGTGVNLNYRKDNLNFFVNYGINYRKNPAKGFAYQEFYNDDETHVTIVSQDRERGGLSNNIRSGIDFTLSDNQTLTGALTYRISDENNDNVIKYYDYDVPGNGMLLGIVSSPNDPFERRIDDEKEDETSLEYSLNYRNTFGTKGKQLSASVSYQSNEEIESSQLTQNLIIPGESENPDTQLRQRSGNEEAQNEFRFQLDYEQPSGKNGKMETGLLASVRNITNDFTVEEFMDGGFEELAGVSNIFDYQENVLAGYGIYGDKIGKISYQIGLRGEYSDVITELIETNEVNDRNYFGLFPSGHFNYELPGQNSMQISYSRRIQRPRFWYLNPFFTFADNRNFFEGNPNLEPEYTDSYEMGHIKYWESGNIGSSIYYRHTTGKIERLKTITDEGITIRRPENLATEDNYGLEFLFAYTGLNWWRLDGNVNFYRAIGKGDVGDQNFDFDTYSYDGRITSKFNFWKNADFQVRMNHRGPRENGQGSSEAVTSLDLGFSKDFYDNNMTITISGRDIFNSRKRKSEIFESNFYELSEFQWRSRTISATVSYRINMKKQREKQERGEGDFEGGDF